MHPAIIIGTVRSLIVDVAMGQIPRSTERISSLIHKTGFYLYAYNAGRYIAIGEMSVKPASCDKTKETSAKILIPYKRSIHLVLRQKECFVGNYLSLVPEILAQTDPIRLKMFKSIFARSASL